MDRHDLKLKAKELEIHVRIGKSGITDNVIKEINNHFRKKKIVKVKFLKAYIQGKDKKEEAKTLSQLAGAKLIDQIGFVVVLSKN